MAKVVTIRQTATHTILRWVQDDRGLRLKGRAPAVWLELITGKDYRIQQAA